MLDEVLVGVPPVLEWFELAEETLSEAELE